MKSIINEKEYKNALKKITKLINAQEDTPEAAERDQLALVIEEYELIHYPIPAPSPETARRFRIEQEGGCK
ncbi:MAG: transcriptional regulator [Spirochaetales bacterium]|nr:transcriptional regulator [Spirochaetales bacterium]